MSDLDIARILLYRKINKALFYKEIYTRDLIEIMKDFLTSGCKSRNDYEFMIRQLFTNDAYNRDILLKN